MTSNNKPLLNQNEHEALVEDTTRGLKELLISYLDEVDQMVQLAGKSRLVNKSKGKRKDINEELSSSQPTTNGSRLEKVDFKDPRQLTEISHSGPRDQNYIPGHSRSIAVQYGSQISQSQISHSNKADSIQTCNTQQNPKSYSFTRHFPVHQGGQTQGFSDKQPTTDSRNYHSSPKGLTEPFKNLKSGPDIQYQLPGTQQQAIQEQHFPQVTQQPNEVRRNQQLLRPPFQASQTLRPARKSSHSVAQNSASIELSSYYLPSNKGQNVPPEIQQAKPLGKHPPTRSQSIGPVSHILPPRYEPLSLVGHSDPHGVHILNNMTRCRSAGSQRSGGTEQYHPRRSSSISPVARDMSEETKKLEHNVQYAQGADNPERAIQYTSHELLSSRPENSNLPPNNKYHSSGDQSHSPAIKSIGNQQSGVAEQQHGFERSQSSGKHIYQEIRQNGPQVQHVSDGADQSGTIRQNTSYRFQPSSPGNQNLPPNNKYPNAVRQSDSPDIKSVENQQSGLAEQQHSFGWSQSSGKHIYQEIQPIGPEVQHISDGADHSGTIRQNTSYRFQSSSPENQTPPPNNKYPNSVGQSESTDVKSVNQQSHFAKQQYHYGRSQSFYPSGKHMSQEIRQFGPEVQHVSDGADQSDTIRQNNLHGFQSSNPENQNLSLNNKYPNSVGHRDSSGFDLTLNKTHSVSQQSGVREKYPVRRSHSFYPEEKYVREEMQQLRPEAHNVPHRANQRDTRRQYTSHELKTSSVEKHSVSDGNRYSHLVGHDNSPDLHPQSNMTQNMYAEEKHSGSTKLYHVQRSQSIGPVGKYLHENFQQPRLDIHHVPHGAYQPNAGRQYTSQGLQTSSSESQGLPPQNKYNISVGLNDSSVFHLPSNMIHNPVSGAQKSSGTEQYAFRRSRSISPLRTYKMKGTHQFGLEVPGVHQLDSGTQYTSQGLQIFSPEKKNPPHDTKYPSLVRDNDSTFSHPATDTAPHHLSAGDQQSGVREQYDPLITRSMSPQGEYIPKDNQQFGPEVQHIPTETNQSGKGRYSGPEKKISSPSNYHPGVTEYNPDLNPRSNMTNTESTGYQQSIMTEKFDLQMSQSVGSARKHVPEGSHRLRPEIQHTLHGADQPRSVKQYRSHELQTSSPANQSFPPGNTYPYLVGHINYPGSHPSRYMAHNLPAASQQFNVVGKYPYRRSQSVGPVGRHMAKRIHRLEPNVQHLPPDANQPRTDREYSSDRFPTQSPDNQFLSPTNNYSGLLDSPAFNLPSNTTHNSNVKDQQSSMRTQYPLRRSHSVILTGKNTYEIIQQLQPEIQHKPREASQPLIENQYDSHAFQTSSTEKQSLPPGNKHSQLVEHRNFSDSPISSNTVHTQSSVEQQSQSSVTEPCPTKSQPISSQEQNMPLEIQELVPEILIIPAKVQQPSRGRQYSPYEFQNLCLENQTPHSEKVHVDLRKYSAPPEFNPPIAMNQSQHFEQQHLISETQTPSTPTRLYTHPAIQQPDFTDQSNSSEPHPPGYQNQYISYEDHETYFSSISEREMHAPSGNFDPSSSKLIRIRSTVSIHDVQKAIEEIETYIDELISLVSY